MKHIGYALSAEEHAPNDLVRHAARAEQVGFEFLMVSDHFHPWVDQQGHSPFVWSVLGGIAQATERIRVGTGVTAPIMRIHPAIIAQAAATTAAMMPGRFFLGVGTGEALNEHITGEKWPPAQVRLDMLEEAIEVIRSLWQGKLTSHRGRYFTVENARIYTLPEQPPELMMAAAGEDAAKLAARTSDGLISTAPKADLLDTFKAAGGEGKPMLGQATVCFASDEASARKTAHKWWPQTVLSGQLGQELALPEYFESACENVTEEQVAESVTCGPDPAAHVKAIEEFFDAGYDHVYIHQVGPDQDAFFDFYEKEVLPRLER